jgi:hypothetical protein
LRSSKVVSAPVPRKNSASSVPIDSALCLAMLIVVASVVAFSALCRKVCR